MGTDVSNTVGIQNNFTNSFTQNLSQTCSADCNITIDNNQIFVGSGTSVGDITISAGDGCQAEATCSMTQSANITISNLINSMIDQEITSVTDMFGDFQSSELQNNANVNNYINNYVTQISSQSCQANSSVSVSDNTIYVGSGSSAGNLTITGGGGSSATASCAMTNMAKASAYNQATTTSTQKGTAIGMFAMFGVALMALLLIGGIIIVVMIATGSLGLIFGGKGKGVGDDSGLGGLDPATINQFASSYFESGGSAAELGEEAAMLV